MTSAAPESANTADGTGRPAVGLFPLALWFAIGTGLLEIAVPVRDRLAEDRFLLDPQIVWMAPLADAMLFGLIAGILVLVARGMRRSMFGVAIFVFGWLAMWSAPYLLPRLYRPAVLILAAGIALQLARFAIRRQALVSRIVRTTLVPLVVLVLVLAAAVHIPRRMRERRAIAALPAAPPGTRNIILLILDTVRARSLSAYGYARPTTPNLARFAAQGIRFDRAMAPAPWTLPSHASMFTGYWPTELKFGWSAPLDDARPTVAEYLTTHGYASAGFVGNLLYTTRESGLSRGFIHYEDYPTSPGQAFISSSIGRWISHPIERLLGSDFLFGRKHGRLVSDGFLAWLDRGRPRSAPFFAFLNYYDAHDPYEPAPEYVRRFVQHPPAKRRPGGERASAAEAEGLRELYEASIAELDAEVGRLLAQLDSRGLLDSTMVIITSDHGEEFQEHGVGGHGNSLYLASLHVPLVVRMPGGAGGGAVVKETVSLRNIAATLVGFAGMATGSPFPGRTLLEPADSSAPPVPALAALDKPSRALVWAAVAKGDMRAVTVGPYHFIRGGDGTEQLFELLPDHTESADLIADPASGALVSRLAATLDSLAPHKRLQRAHTSR